MRRKPRRTRITELALEGVGAAAFVYGVSLWSIPLAVLLAGVLLIVAAQMVEKA